MKNILYVFVCVLFVSTCDDNEPLIQGPVNPEPEPEMQAVDSIQLNLVNLNTISESDDFVIFDFTARVPGYIWGCTTLDESDNEYTVLFSYNLATDQINLIPAPIDLGLSNFQKIEAAPDGKLYVHSSGFLHNTVAVFDTNTTSWSSIEVPGLVYGITVDEVDNILWIAHNKGVSRYQNGSVFTFDETNSNLRRTMSGPNNSFFGSELAIDAEGVLWYANLSTLYTFVDGEWSLHPLSPLSEQVIISHIIPSEPESVLVKVPSESLYRLSINTEIRNYNNISELIDPAKPIIDLVDRLADGSIIYSHLGGFSFYNSLLDTTIQVDASNSLLPVSRAALKLDRDAEGNVWIGGDNVLGTLPSEW